MKKRKHNEIEDEMKGSPLANSSNVKDAKDRVKYSAKRSGDTATN
jgi:hypothetical protein